jgi:hypothetical protein
MQENSSSSTTCNKLLDVKLYKVEIANRNHTRKLALKKTEGQEWCFKLDLGRTRGAKFQYPSP